MGFLSFLALCGIAYMLWRASEQLPDLIFRLSEIQRDLADIRRELADRTPNTDQGEAQGSDSGPDDSA